jgi:hypothetical protein
MYKLEELVSLLDHALNSRRKRHIAGGVLMSLSLLFGGLAVTILTIKHDDVNNDEKENYNEVYLD